MRKVSVVVFFLVLYLILANLTGWLLVRTFIRSFPFHIQGRVQPTLLLGTTSIRDVTFQPVSGVEVRARSIHLSYNAFLLAVGQAVPLTLTARKVEVVSQEGIGGLTSVNRLQFDSLEAWLGLRTNRRLTVKKVQARGAEMNVQAQGEINLHRESVDIKLRVEPQPDFLARLSSDAQENLFRPDAAEHAVVLEIHGNLTHPSVYFQSDLVQVSVQ